MQPQSSFCLVHKKKHVCFCCFILLIKRCMVLYFNMTMPDPMQYATPHSSLPTTTSKVLSWPSLIPDLLKPQQTNLEQGGEMFPKLSKCPCKCAWVLSITQAGMGGLPSASGLQPDRVYAWEMLGSYWFSIFKQQFNSKADQIYAFFLKQYISIVHYQCFPHHLLLWRLLEGDCWMFNGHSDLCACCAHEEIYRHW